MTAPAGDSLRRLIEDGFCVLPGILSEELLARLRAVTDRLVAAQTAEQAARQRNTGSMIPASSDPLLAELITWPPALEVFRAMGYPRPSFSDGWIISKPPRGPRLFWHHDWFAWDDPASYRREPLQVALMYYLHDTTRENGCLRVIPGSHNRHNPLYEMLDAPREELVGSDDSARPEFADRPDEMDVPVRPGDLVIADARLLHAARENRTHERRLLITLWYQPDLTSLPERIRAQMAAKAQTPGSEWPEHAIKLWESIRTRYDGVVEPCPRTMYRPSQRSLPIS